MAAGRVPKHVYGLRSIAVTEFVKGAGAIVAAIVLWLHPHASYGHIAERVLRVFHIHRNSDFAVQVISWAGRIDVRDIHVAVTFACTYAALRFAEGWGLWRARTWAEWFGFLNGVLYLPIEILEIHKRFHWLKLTILIINVVVVLYLGWEIRKGQLEALKRREPRSASQSLSADYS